MTEIDFIKSDKHLHMFSKDDISEIKDLTSIELS